MARYKRRKGDIMSESDEEADSSPLPASTSFDKKPSASNDAVIKSVTVIEESSSANVTICIPETPESSPLIDYQSSPASSFSRAKLSRDAKKSNFEGFACSNSTSGLLLESDMSEDESWLTSAQAQQQSVTVPLDNAGGISQHNQETKLTTTNNSLGKVIVIEPIADLCPVEKFFSNDLTLSKALANSPFGKAGIATVSKNLSRKILVITFEKEPGFSMASLLKVDQLASWKIRCRLPVNLTKSVGVIGPLGDDVSNNDLSEALALAGYNDVTAERILKGKNKEATSMFKVTFNLSTLPTYVCLGYQRFQVNPYFNKPWQCFKCQYFGHSAISCKNKPRCVVCGGPHSVKDCTVQGNPHCCNCGGQHTASYGGCRFVKEAKAVERIRVKQKISYHDALRVVKQSVNKNWYQASDAESPVAAPSQPNLSSYPKPEQRTWAQRVKPSCYQATKSVTTGTQTDSPTPTLQSLTVTQFVELLSKIISLCAKTDNLDTMKIVNDLTRETLQLDSSKQDPTTDSTNSCSALLLATNARTSCVPASKSNQAEAPMIMDTEITEVSIEPSPIIGKKLRKVAQGTMKVIGNQTTSKGKNKSRSTCSSMASDKDNAEVSKQCLPTKK
jgi:hypothetical protein